MPDSGFYADPPFDAIPAVHASYPPASDEQPPAPAATPVTAPDSPAPARVGSISERGTS